LVLSALRWRRVHDLRRIFSLKMEAKIWWEEKRIWP
jgi:hypothetical protein